MPPLISVKRPQPATQVVPIEPTLRYSRFNLIVSAFILPLYIANLYLVANAGIVNNSLFNTLTLSYLIYTVASLSSFPRWNELDQRRQQATRYNLVVGVRSRVAGQNEAATSALPDCFTCRVPSDQLINNLVLAILSLILLFTFSSTIYTNWQTMLQATQHGAPMALVILENGLNIIALLGPIGCLGILLFSFLYPRQITATREGLTYRNGYRTTSISWQQARLFAFANQSYKHAICYELASENALIRWPYKVSLAREYSQQVQFLNIIIVERTGLPLYDLR